MMPLSWAEENRTGEKYRGGVCPTPHREPLLDQVATHRVQHELRVVLELQFLQHAGAVGADGLDA